MTSFSSLSIAKFEQRQKRNHGKTISQRHEVDKQVQKNKEGGKHDDKPQWEGKTFKEIETIY